MSLIKHTLCLRESHYPLITSLLLQLLSWLFFVSSASSQNIHLVLIDPPGITLCESSKARLIVFNDSNSNLDNISIKLILPDGLIYLSGSVNGASETNISQLSSPEFKLIHISGKDSVEITVLIEAGCALFNTSTKLFNKWIIQSGNEIDSIGSSSKFYPFDSPYLKIDIDNIDTSAVTGSVFKRRITITNTGIGSLTRFVYQDFHDGLDIGSTNGTLLNQTQNLLALAFDKNDFVKVGNRDSFLDRDESVVITETVRQTNCLLEKIQSHYIGYWGCGNDTCQIAESHSNIDFISPNVFAKFQFATERVFPDCICNALGTPQVLIITNTGQRTAENIQITLKAAEILASNPYGIVRGSVMISGPASILDIQYLDSVSLSSCKTDQLFATCLLRLTDLGPGEEIKITFNYSTCLSCPPSNEGIAWYYGYSFNSKCVPNSTVFSSVDTKVTAPNPGNKISTKTIILNPGNNLVENKIYTVQSSISFSKMITDQYLTLSYTIPCPLRLADTTFFLNGIPPLSKNIVELDSMIELTLVFQPPFQDQLVFEFGIKVDCNYLCNINLSKASNTQFYSSCPNTQLLLAHLSGLICITAQLSCANREYECGPCANGMTPYDLKCSNVPTQKDSVYSYLDGVAHAYRKNYGNSDADNDRFAEIGTLDTALTQIKKLITGDTLVNEFRTMVVVNDARFYYDSILFMISSNPLLSFDTVYSEIQIKDVSTNMTYHCIYPVSNKYTEDNPIPNCLYSVVTRTGYGNGLIVPLNPELLNRYGANLPADFKFENGDSILANIYARVSSYADQRIVPVTLTYRAFFIDRSQVKPDPFSCMAYKDSILLATQGLSFFPDMDTLYICKSGFQLFESEIRGTASLENFFTHEFRNTYSLDSLKIQLSNPNLIMDSIRLEFLYQSGTNSRLISSAYYPVRQRKGRWEIDPVLLEGHGYDESYTIRIAPYVHVKDCAIFTSSFNLVISTFYLNGNNGNVFYEINSSNTIVNNILYSNTNTVLLFNGNDGLKNPSSTIYSSSDKIHWAFLLSGLRVPGGFEFEFHSKNNSIQNIQLQSMPDVKTTKPDSFTIDVRNLSVNQNYEFDFSANHSFCRTDTFFVISRWVCPADSIDLKDLCNVDTFMLIIIPDHPELMLDESSEIKESVLCDTLPEISLELYNADKGAAFGVYLDVYIPPGTSLILSALLFSYPFGSPYLLLPAPISLGSDRYRWIFSDIIPFIKQNGLPGIKLPPDGTNSIGLKMKLLTSCNAIVNSSPTFYTSGTNPCGDSINTVLKPGPLISIKGLSSSGKFTLSMANDSLKACDEETTIRISLSKDELTQLSDSLKLNLPDGLHYKTNSIQIVSNMSAKDPVILHESGNESLHFGLMDSLPASARIEFTIKINGIKNILCSSQRIIAFTFSRTTTFCKATQTNCDVLIESGTSDLIINQKTGSVILDSFQLIKNKDSLNYKLNFKFQIIDRNLFSDSLICLGLYDDLNLNHTLDATDKLIGTYCISLLKFKQDGFYVFDTIINKSLITSCNFILASLPTNCICKLDTLSYQLSTVQVVSIKKNQCAGDSNSVIGVPSDLTKKYKWTKGMVSCDTCSLTNIILDPNISVDTTLNFTLIESGSTDCNKEYRFQIAISKANAGPDQMLSCLSLSGGSTVLSAKGTGIWRPQSGNPGATNITNPSSPVTTVFGFMAPGTYHFIWTTDSGCSDTINVFVTQKSDAGVDKYLCTDIPGGLVTMSGTGIGLWSALSGNPGTAVITAPSSGQTTITDFSNTGTYFFLWTDANGCSDTVSLIINQLPKGKFKDTASCPGYVITINAANRMNYMWKGDSISNPLRFEQSFINSKDRIIYLTFDSINCPSQDTFFIHPLIDTTQISLILGDSVVAPGKTAQYCIKGGKWVQWIPDYKLDCDTCHCVIISPVEDTIYQVEVKDSFGCPHVFQFRITVLSPGCDSSTIFIPNAFSPNQDRHNDTLFVRSKFITRMHLGIYNRWGEKVFETFDIQNGWDGTFKDKLLPPDVFGYFLEAECIDGKKYFKKGNVSLLK